MCCCCFLVLAIAYWRHLTGVAIARTASPVAAATPSGIVAACCCASHRVFRRSVAICCLASSLRAARGGSCGCWRGVAVRIQRAGRDRSQRRGSLCCRWCRMFPVDATRFSAEVMAYLFVAFACGAFGGCRKHNEKLVCSACCWSPVLEGGQ